MQYKTIHQMGQAQLDFLHGYIYISLMTTTSKIVRLCQDILALTIEQDAEKERLYSLLDDSITDLAPTTITAIICDLRLLGIHESLLLNRNEYEYNREFVLAKSIIEAGNQSPLQDFRSAEWYENAHQFENKALAQHSPTNILMVGCGPFPSTVMSLMNDFPNATVTCVDRSYQATTLAIEVGEIFRHEVYAIPVDGLELDAKSLEFYDCILVGAVVGVTEQDKERTVDHFLKITPPGATLAFRTATGPGKIIYHTVDIYLLAGHDFQVLPNPPQKTWTTILAKP